MSGRLASGNIYRITEMALQILTPDGAVLAEAPADLIVDVASRDTVVTVRTQNGKDFTLGMDSSKAASELAKQIRARYSSQIPTHGNSATVLSPNLENVDHDNRAQLARIAAGIVPGETLYAVYDMKGGGTGFIGLTDRRLIVQDEGRVRKLRSLISIPYSQIAMVASKDEGGLVRRSSEMTIVTSAGTEFEFDFRSSDKAERAYRIIIQHLR